MTNPTPELVRAALQYIPANLPRDDWAKVCAAIKSEFPDEIGRTLFTEWSATADNYDPKAVASTWKSIKASGGVTIGTLLGMAKERGFVIPKSNQPAPKPDPATAARMAAERKAKQAAEQAAQDAAHAAAALEAAKLWEGASTTGESPYLMRKGVQPYGVRFGAGGWLYVPLRDATGTLWNVQRIAPTKPDSGPDKLFLKGGRKSGLWHWCGDAPPTAAVVLIAEGYATAASLHEATGHPVAVAFDAGNLAHVAKALRTQYPAALLVLCGDDDAGTQHASGHNPGRDKATAAAKAVQGIAVFPDQLPDGGSDFNDLHQHLGGAAGLEAVRVLVQVAIDQHQATQTAAHATQKATKQTNTPEGGHQAPANEFDRYSVDDAGVWFNGVDQEGKSKPPEWICSPLEVVAMTRDQDGDGWGYLLSFSDPIGRPKQWAMPSRMLSGDGGEYRSTLLNMGLRIAQSTRARNLLSQYIQTRKPSEFASCTDHIGWHGRAFVLPKETIGEGAERIVFQTDSAMENTFRAKGTADHWRTHVGALCAGNSRLVFAVACAFAGPLLRPAGVESGGFHFRGNSSSGKTTALKVAASVYGGPSYLQRWRTTDNALEAIAAQHSDALLILDELAQVDPKTAGECAYMLANEQSKARATRSGAPRARLLWRLLFLSAGELGLADHMAEGMKRARTGQEVRMADIPADAGAGMGAFENLHGQHGGAAFATHITGMAGTVYGAVGLAWLKWLTEHVDTLKVEVRQAVDAVRMKLVPHGASGQVERVGARFALVAAAGEMATRAGLTGWDVGESERAATACFNAWLAARGGAGNGEVQTILRKVRSFLELYGESGFTWWHRAMDDRNAKTLNRCGFRRLVHSGEPINSEADFQREYGDDLKSVPSYAANDTATEFIVMKEAFKTMCPGYEPDEVARVLRDHGCLRTEGAGRLTYKTRLPGIGDSRCYCITPKIFELDI
jgi:putative DNA primase/helicase